MTLLISLFVLSILIAHSAASTCGGNCPSGKCPSCPCGTTPSKVDVATWCSKYSWNQAACQCIMNAESAGNSNTMNYNSDGSFDVGLWLVNNYNWNACSGGSAPCGASANLQCGKSPLRKMFSTFCFYSFLSTQPSTCTTGVAELGNSGRPARNVEFAIPTEQHSLRIAFICSSVSSFVFIVRCALCAIVDAQVFIPESFCLSVCQQLPPLLLIGRPDITSSSATASPRLSIITYNPPDPRFLTSLATQLHLRRNLFFQRPLQQNPTTIQSCSSLNYWFELRLMLVNLSLICCLWLDYVCLLPC